MTYSSDEIDTSVGQLVQGSSTFTQDGLGGRNVKSRFEDTRELVDSVFLYEPDTVYYVIYKAVARTRSLLTSLLNTMDDLSDDIDEMAIPSKAVADTTGLADASTALSIISGALSRRGSISAAEYNRYDKAISRASDKYKLSVKRTYTPFGGSQATTDVVRSSSEASADLSTNFSSFSASYATLLESVDRIISAESDYDHNETVRTVASRQISRIESELSTLEEAFEAATPEKRAKTARADLLTILSNKSAVKSLSRIRYPGEPKIEQTSSGASTWRAAAYGTGVPPTITGSVSGPWPILSTHELAIDFNSTDPTVSVSLVSGASAVPGITAASLTGANAEYAGVSFAINESLDTPWPLWSGLVAAGGLYTTLNNFFYLIVDGTLFKVSDNLPAGFTANLDATNLANAINTVAGTHVSASKGTNGVWDWVELDYNVGSPPTIYQNRYMQIASGPNNVPDLVLWRVMVGSPPTTYYNELTTGWDGNDKLWIWPNDLTEAAALEVDLPNGTWPNYVVNTASVVSAIDAETEVSSAASNGRVTITSADSGEGSVLRIIAEGSSTRKTASYLGMETLGFFEGQESRESDVGAQTIVDVLNADSAFKANAVAELIKNDVFSAKKAYGDSADILAIDIDEDPRSGWVISQMKVSVGSGENEGIYGISSTDYVSPTLFLELDRNLRDPSEVGLRVDVYEELLKITATDSSTTSYIDVDQTDPNTAHSVLGLTEVLTRGTVVQLLVQYNHPIQGWVNGDLTGYGIKVGDVILLEDDTYVTTITGIDSISSGIIDVEAVSPTLALTAFTIQSVSAENHRLFTIGLQDWRDSLSSDLVNLTSLTKSVNFLLLNKNPPRGRVQAAATDLQDVRAELEGSVVLSGILASFTVLPIDAVDRALQVMSENGQDRARDLLTDGKFSDYQATNYKTASRSGAMMDASSKVATNDLVEPTKTRPETIGEITRLRSTTFDEIDPKYDFGDIRSGSTPIYLDYFSADLPGEK